MGIPVGVSRDYRHVCQQTEGVRPTVMWMVSSNRLVIWMKDKISQFVMSKAPFCLSNFCYSITCGYPLQLLQPFQMNSNQPLGSQLPSLQCTTRTVSSLYLVLQPPASPIEQLLHPLADGHHALSYLQTCKPTWYVSLHNYVFYTDFVPVENQ